MGGGGGGVEDDDVRCRLPCKMMLGRHDDVRRWWLRKMMVLGWGWRGGGVMMFVADCHQR